MILDGKKIEIEVGDIVSVFKHNNFIQFCFNRKGREMKLPNKDNKKLINTKPSEIVIFEMVDLIASICNLRIKQVRKTKTREDFAFVPVGE